MGYTTLNLLDIKEVYVNISEKPLTEHRKGSRFDGAAAFWFLMNWNLRRNCAHNFTLLA